MTTFPNIFCIFLGISLSKDGLKNTYQIPHKINQNANTKNIPKKSSLIEIQFIMSYLLDLKVKIAKKENMKTIIILKLFLLSTFQFHESNNIANCWLNNDHIKNVKNKVKKKLCMWLRPLTQVLNFQVHFLKNFIISKLKNIQTSYTNFMCNANTPSPLNAIRPTPSSVHDSTRSVDHVTRTNLSRECL